MVLAAEIFGAKKIHSDLRYFSRQELYEATNQIRKKSVSQRISQHPRLKTRADIFPAGILLICILLEKLQLEELYITRRGLRHGIILSAS